MGVAERFKRLAAAAQDEAFDLREHVAPVKLDPARCKLGHIYNTLHHPQARLRDYIEGEPTPPAAVHRSHPEFAWGSLLNDQISDCGEAMVLHGIEAFHLDAGTEVPPFGDRDASNLYTAVMGYNPSDPTTDQGTDNNLLMKYWLNTGVICSQDTSRHQIAGSLFIEPQDEVASKIAIWEFVVLFRALGLPITAQGQSYWQLKDPSLKGDAAVGSWGYHDIPYLSYDRQRLRNCSWGQELLVDWDFDTAYAVGGIVVITQEMLDQRGVSPAGVNWDKLSADFRAMPPAPSN